MSRDGGEPVLDPGVLAELARLDEGQATRMIDELGAMFIGDAPGRLDAMARDLGAGRASAVRAEAHKLKSASGNIGALRFSRLCGELENASEAVFQASGAGIVEALREELERVRGALADV